MQQLQLPVRALCGQQVEDQLKKEKKRETVSTQLLVESLFMWNPFPRWSESRCLLSHERAGPDGQAQIVPNPPTEYFSRVCLNSKFLQRTYISWFFINISFLPEDNLVAKCGNKTYSFTVWQDSTFDPPDSKTVVWHFNIFHIGLWTSRSVSSFQYLEWIMNFSVLFFLIPVSKGDGQLARGLHGLVSRGNGFHLSSRRLQNKIGILQSHKVIFFGQE